MKTRNFGMQGRAAGRPGRGRAGRAVWNARAVRTPGQVELGLRRRPGRGWVVPPAAASRHRLLARPRRICPPSSHTFGRTNGPAARTRRFERPSQRSSGFSRRGGRGDCSRRLRPPRSRRRRRHSRSRRHLKSWLYQAHRLRRLRRLRHFRLLPTRRRRHRHRRHLRAGGQRRRRASRSRSTRRGCRCRRILRADASRSDRGGGTR